MEVRPFLVGGLDTGSLMHYHNGKSYMVCTKNRYRESKNETNPPTVTEESAVPSSNNA